MLTPATTRASGHARSIKLDTARDSEPAIATASARERRQCRLARRLFPASAAAERDRTDTSRSAALRQTKPSPAQAALDLVSSNAALIQVRSNWRRLAILCVSTLVAEETHDEPAGIRTTSSDSRNRLDDAAGEA